MIPHPKEIQELFQTNVRGHHMVQQQNTLFSFFIFISGNTMLKLMWYLYISLKQIFYINSFYSQERITGRQFKFLFTEEP